MANKKQAQSTPPRPRTRMVLERPPRLRKDPLAWGMLAGGITAVIILLSALVRQYYGAVVTPASLLLWVFLAFVISYGLAGCFAFFVIRVAADSIEKPVARNRRTHSKGAAASKPLSPEALAALAQAGVDSAKLEQVLGAPGGKAPPSPPETGEAPQE